MHEEPPIRPVVSSLKAMGLLLLFWLSHTLLFGTVNQPPKSNKLLSQYHEYVVTQPTAASPSSIPHELQVLVYNVYMRYCVPLLFPDGQRTRVEVIPSYLRGYDVLVLLEVFDQQIRSRLIEKLRHWYPYHTKELGGGSWITANGGVLLLSRWPIRTQDSMLYKACVRTDCASRKGVVYAAIQKKNVPYHIFATHTQAHSNLTSQGVRTEQFLALNRFLESKSIPSNEPVLIGGDLNVDKLHSPGEYRDMLSSLKVNSPHSFLGLPWTFQPKVNQLAHGSKPEFLDYVLVSKKHLQPTKSTLTTQAFLTKRPWRNFNKDLSDHYPVVGKFQFPTTAN